MRVRFARVTSICAVGMAALWPAFCLAQSPSQSEAKAGFAEIQIKNFGRVNNILYRGAQPRETDYRALAAIGIKTVLDLQRDGESDEQEHVESAGMKFVRIGMSDTDHPKHEQLDQALKLISDPANQPVFVHCRGGRHRTGAVVAIYRLAFENWDVERAYDEMKSFQFKKGFGHGALKDCVYEHSADIVQEITSAGSSASAGSNK